MRFLPLVLLSSIVSGQEQEPYRFEVEVRTVYVDVFVSRDGKPVTGLTAADFEVLDNGIRQEADLLDAEDVPLSAMLVLDTSQTVVGEKLEHLRVAAHAFIDGLDDKDETGLLSFTHELQLREEIGSDFAEVHQALEQPMQEGGTGFNDAVYTGLVLAEAREGRPLVLVFTDGLDNASWLTHTELNHVVQDSEAVVFLVGVGSTAGGTASSRWSSEARAKGFLHGLARITGGKVWYADSSANLKEIFLNVLAEMKSRYLLSFQPRGVNEEGWHTLQVRLRSRKADEIRFRPGYQGSGSR